MPLRTKTRRGDAYSKFTVRSLAKFYATFRGHECRRCGRTFDDRRALYRHRQRHCEPPPRPGRDGQLDLDLE
jgi:hypothetical protein